MTFFPPTPPIRPRDWMPRRDWIGRHIVVAAIVGGIAAALLSWVLFAFIKPWDSDALLSAARNADEAAEEARNAGFQQGYDEVFDDALAAAVEAARVSALIDLVIHSGAGGDAAWAMGVRHGWADGWNDALDAMRQTSVDAGVPPDATEFRTLAEASRRSPPLPGG